MARTKKTTSTVAPTETVTPAPAEETTPVEASVDAMTEPETTPSSVEPESELPLEEPKASLDDVPLTEESAAQIESPITRESFVPETAAEVNEAVLLEESEAQDESEPSEKSMVQNESVPQEESNVSDKPEPSEETDTQDETCADDGKTRLAISLPIEPFKRSYGSLQRLKDLTLSKETLLKVALGAEDLSFTTDDEKVSFPWFTLQEPGRASDEVDAYTKLIVAMARKAVTQSRVSGKEKPNPDPRLAMRLFLINLGFIGDEFKSARAILLRNFKAGNSSMNFSSDFPEAFPIITVLKEDHHV